jgi:hypothetical protein
MSGLTMRRNSKSFFVFSTFFICIFFFFSISAQTVSRLERLAGALEATREALRGSAPTDPTPESNTLNEVLPP